MGSVERPPTTEFDIIIVGAGISGINAAYRVQAECPNQSYTILESRDVLGGTWDLFRYPGIRSDSDLHTFGYPWRPWSEEKAIAEGEPILNYIKASAKETGIDKKIQFGHKLQAADWESKNQRWILEVDVRGERKYFSAKFIFLSTGYYDYEKPIKAEIPGLETFQGDVVHPQFWPQDLDYANKSIIVIGSGATAVTLVPTLAKTATSVTQLQRSPSYIFALPSNSTGYIFRAIFPYHIAETLIRWRHIVVAYLFFLFCTTFPSTARLIFSLLAKSKLPSSIPHDPHFKPTYNPWEQRICFCPDGDYFDALRKGNAHIVTDTIKAVSEKGIMTSSGQFLPADIIITATGLRILVAGGTRITLDKQPFTFGDKYLWNGAMLQDLPNAAYVIGYPNLSWTVGADATAVLAARLLNYMEKEGIAVVIPRLEKNHGMKSTTALDLKSTYIERSKSEIPLAGDKNPWRPRNNPVKDIWVARLGNLTKGLEVIKKGGDGKKTK